MKNILFVQLNFDLNAPRNIRTHHILNYLSSNYNISVLTFSSTSKERVIENVAIHRVNYGFLNQYFALKFLTGKKATSPIFLLFQRAITFLLTTFAFPDTWIYDKNIILDYCNAQLKQHDFDIIVGSIAPFSNYAIASEVRDTLYPNAKLVFDIGDPLFKNSGDTRSNSPKHFEFERKYFQKAQAAIVTNAETKAFYIDEKVSIDATKVFVIPQAVDLDSISKAFEKVSTQYDFSAIEMIYAGALYPDLRNPYPLFNCITNAKDLPIHFSLYGAGDWGLKDKRILFHEKIEQTELFKTYTQSNLLLFCDNASGIQSPGKLFELLATKKPILFLYTNEASETHKTVTQYDHVFCVKNDESSIKAFFDDFVGKKFVFDLSYNINTFSWKNRALLFQQVIEQ